MRSIVVFLGGLIFVVYGKQVGDEDSTWAGCLLIVTGLLAMGIGWAQKLDKE